MRLVAEDMSDPIAREFQLTFADINYGNDLRRALLGLLLRVPSVSMMAVVTAVLVQKETGGNLAEIFEQIAHVIRGRFRFSPQGQNPVGGGPAVRVDSRAGAAGAVRGDLGDDA